MDTRTLSPPWPIFPTAGDSPPPVMTERSSSGIVSRTRMFSRYADTPVACSALPLVVTAARSSPGASTTRPRRGAPPALDPETAGELSLRRAAVERVQSLLARHLLKAEVIEALRAEESLSSRLRSAALEIAEHRTENALGLYQAGWLGILRPGGKADDYHLAARRLEGRLPGRRRRPRTACGIQESCPRPGPVPGRPARRERSKRLTTLPALTTEPPAKATSGHNVAPLDLAVTAMASQQLGDAPRAPGPLSNSSEKLVQSDQWANDQESRRCSFMRRRMWWVRPVPGGSPP